VTARRQSSLALGFLLLSAATLALDIGWVGVPL
jgi:hypothetical protein